MSSPTSFAQQVAQRIHKGKAPEDESSRKNTRTEYIEVPTGNQILLMTPAMLSRYKQLLNFPIVQWKYVDLTVLEEFECKYGLERLIQEPYWNHLLSLRQDTFIPLVHEFIASLHVEGVTGDLYSPTIKFRLFNQDHHISANNLGVLLGFYEEGDQSKHWYRRLKHDFGDRDTPRKYWAMIAKPGIDWVGSRVRVFHIVREDLRVLWKVIAHSWEGRPEAYDRVSKTELFMLWSMDTGSSVNMSLICKNWLIAQQQESTRAIFIGPLVTRLCVALGHQMKMHWFEHRLQGAHIVPLLGRRKAKSKTSSVN
ncbi:uncharacterized protein LOC116015386 [Ipomoea triloba]|uniref:uncharacterized protein LOC116015386 n=1 Tax=Ipomoea triloba TaxID=35885 RepID=UPI00125E421C|nr:uncharacterized protein LOC116015386 [Ipomoea triloba]XP_031111291.1 uncharacterized protein LOC116015386 [Ipomoea triloba]XP_031111293.1 uncharacterized protein LOC116015386 [Ipomoea triloba]XP_031111294.1 uncharacterized protein LOC116015386 [Ipomoea triloba]